MVFYLAVVGVEDHAVKLVLLTSWVLGGLEALAGVLDLTGLLKLREGGGLPLGLDLHVLLKSHGVLKQKNTGKRPDQSETTYFEPYHLLLLWLWLWLWSSGDPAEGGERVSL